ncbi:putative lipid-binding protein At4g00165 [Wolffia australiana]
MASKSQFVAALVLANFLLSALVTGQVPTPAPPPPPPTGLIPCVFDILKFAICGPVLLLFNLLGIAPQPTGPCCTVVNSLSMNGAISCLCVGIKANILGINISIPGNVTLLIRLCGRDVPFGIGCS